MGAENLTTVSAADALGISRPTLMKLISDGQIPTFRAGSHTRLRAADVMALKERRAAARRRAVQDLLKAGDAFDDSED